MSQLGQSILQRAKELEDIRRDYEDGLWNDIGKYVNPRREDLRAYDNTRTKGRRRGKSAYANTAQQALGVWSDGIQGLVVTESERWFKSQLSLVGLNRLPEVIEWLQEYDDAMYAAFNRGNFYTALPLYLRDGGSIGTATMFTEEDIAGGKQVHTPVHPREVFIAENRFGKVDTVFRKFEKTARQLVQEFENARLPLTVVNNAKNQPDFSYIIWHAVWPNTDTWTPKKGNKDFRSVYVIGRDAASSNAGHSAAVSPSGGVGNDKDVIKEGGFDINPYAVWRFRKNSDEIYGYSPAADNIVPIFKDNQFGKTLLTRAQIEATPPANVPAQMRNNVRLGPGGLNYFENPQDIASYIGNPGNYTVCKDREDKIEEVIRDAYSNKLFTFLLNSEREKTAFEIDRTEAQQALLIAPQTDQLFKEGIEPNFDIVAKMEERAGRLPPAPPIVQAFAEKENVQITVRLTGPLVQAQKRVLVLGPIRAAHNELGLMAQLHGPSVFDRIDVDEVVEGTLDAVNFPRKWMRRDEEVDEIRKQRAEEEAKQKQMEMLAGAADAYPKVTGAPEEGSPAEALAGVA